MAGNLPSWLSWLAREPWGAPQKHLPCARLQVYIATPGFKNKTERKGRVGSGAQVRSSCLQSSTLQTELSPSPSPRLLYELPSLGDFIISAQTVLQFSEIRGEVWELNSTWHQVGVAHSHTNFEIILSQQSTEGHCLEDMPLINNRQNMRAGHLQSQHAMKSPFVSFKEDCPTHLQPKHKRYRVLQSL